MMDKAEGVGGWGGVPPCTSYCINGCYEFKVNIEICIKETPKLSLNNSA